MNAISPRTDPPNTLTVPEILKQLERIPAQDLVDFAPFEAALEAATTHRDAIVPELIAAVDRVTDDPRRYLEDSGYVLHHMAIALLAEFREPRALEPLIRFLSLPGELALDLTGDLVTEELATVLAAVCRGNPTPLIRLARDEALNRYVRGQAIEALAAQALWGERTREEVVADYRRLFDGGLSRTGDPSVWAFLVCSVGDYHVPELLPEVRRAFAERLVNEDIVTLDCAEEDLGLLRGAMHEDFLSRNGSVPTAVDLIKRWLCFVPDEPEDALSGKDEIPLDDDEDDWLDEPPHDPAMAGKPLPYVAPVKVGRNEPCPCGSGKKYKKCCGQ